MSLLREQQVEFARLLPRLIDHAFDLGLEVVLGECWRTPEQAQWNADHGTGIKNSLHCDRLAVDLILFRDGVWLQRSEDYEDLGSWWEKQHDLACWGGRFRDGSHFSLTWEGRK